MKNKLCKYNTNEFEGDLTTHQSQRFYTKPLLGGGAWQIGYSSRKCDIFCFTFACNAN